MRTLKYFAILGLGVALSFQACSPAGGNSTGHEYMPDMGHPVSYEANVYDDYSYNSWNSSSVKDRKSLSNMNQPVSGTIARGYVGVASDDEAKMMLVTGQSSNSAIRTPMNGNVPYYYGNTEEERTRATKEIVGNPYPITKVGLEKGKELYGIYCASCHGTKGDGQGWLVSEENKLAKYPAQPANFLQDQFYTSNNGRYYHAIMHGKNVMQQHRDKLSYEERWQVIHYIRNMQAAAKQLKYDDAENTFFPTAGISYAVIAAKKAAEKAAMKPAVVPTTMEHHEGAPAHPAAPAHGGGEHHGHK
jgi:mono/diheme cytochrome c family protein